MKIELVTGGNEGSKNGTGPAIFAKNTDGKAIKATIEAKSSQDHSLFPRQFSIEVPAGGETWVGSSAIHGEEHIKLSYKVIREEPVQG